MAALQRGEAFGVKEEKRTDVQAGQGVREGGKAIPLRSDLGTRENAHGLILRLCRSGDADQGLFEANST